MTEYKPLDVSVLKSYGKADRTQAEIDLNQELLRLDRKIVVLDDDPTGVQTVHGVSVYTSWDVDTIRQGFVEKNRIFFILTNSRSFTAAQTEAEHRQIARNILAASKESGKDFLLISRSDSTLRGYYPLETKTLREEIEKGTAKRFDGEIIFPFFKEGGRFTIGNVHYVREGELLTPAGLTEFAKDKTFGYTASHLGEWCEEKTQGTYKAKDVAYILLEDLRSMDYDRIDAQLMGVESFGKVVVNAIDYADVAVLCTAFLRAMRNGKEFLFRSAAAVTKVLGGVPDRALLTKDELVAKDNRMGGIVLVGSHVKKTTQQLDELKHCKYPVVFIEFDQHLVLEEGGLEREAERVCREAEEHIGNGKTVAVYTKRERFDLDTDDKEEQLKISVRISDAVTSVIGKLGVQPRFIIAKGGITSSDVGVKALRVQRAEVMGQISPGIPVWMTGPESKFPHMPYIIFPGNVGNVETLKEIVETLIGE